MDIARKAGSLVVFVVLAGCGGGGGSGPSRDARLAVGTLEYDTTANDDSSGEVPVTVLFSVFDPPRAGLSANLETDTDLVTSGTVSEAGPEAGRIDLRFAPATGVPPGVHDIHARLSICYDDDCRTHVTGSPVTITFHYDVRPAERHVAIEIVQAPTAYANLAENAAPPPVSATVRVLNPPAEGFVAVDGGLVFGDARVLDGIAIVPTTEGARADASFIPPGEAHIGDYEIARRVVACYGTDLNCPRQIGLSNLQLAYVVTSYPAQVPRTDELQAADIAADPASDRVYFSQEVFGSPSTSRVSFIDGETGDATTGPAVDRVLGAIAIAPDGSVLAAAESNGRFIHRFLLPALAEIEPIDLGPGGPEPDDERFASTLAYGPDGSLGVGLSNLSTQQPADLRVYDGTSMRASTLDAPVRSFAWCDRGTMVASVLASGLDPMRIAKLSIDDTGVAGSTRIRKDLFASSMACASGKVILDSGEVFDLESNQRLAVLEPHSRGEESLAVDESRRLVYMLYQVDRDLIDSRITAYSLDSLEQRGTVVVHPTFSPDRIIRWGPQGLAIHEFGGRVRFLDGGIVDG